MNFPTFIYDDGICKVRDGKEYLERNSIMFVIKNIKTNLFLVVKYKSNNEISFPTGGIKNGDTPQDTLKKELFEESGINNVNNITRVEGGYFEVKYYSPFRDRNNHNKTNLYYGETDKDIDLNVLSEKEKKIQIPLWMKLDEIIKVVELGLEDANYEPMKYVIKLLKESKIIDHK